MLPPPQPSSRPHSPPALGQPPPLMPMRKPRTVFGIQVVLWALGAVAVLGDFYSIVLLVDASNPLSVLSLVYAAYATVQSLLTPVHIARGRRWAWIWTLISSVVGLILAIALTTVSLAEPAESVTSLIIGLVMGVLYGALLGLLCSKSARWWIILHRVGRSAVRPEPVPASALGVPLGTVTEVERERPPRPASALVAQFAAVFFSLFPLALFVPLMISEAQREVEWAPDYEEVTMSEVLFDRQLGFMFLTAVFTALFLLLAFIAVAGFRRGRHWVRLHTRLWVGLPTVYCVIFALSWVVDPQTDQRWMAVAGPAVTVIGVAGIVLLVLTFTSKMRDWTPRPRLVVAVPDGASPQQRPPRM
jgi:MFS family permease